MVTALLNTFAASYTCIVLSRARGGAQAAQLTMPLEKRFTKRLQRSTTAGDDEDTPAAPSQKRGRPMGKYKGVWRLIRVTVHVTETGFETSKLCSFSRQL